MARSPTEVVARQDLRILRGLKRGLTIPEIAARLKMSERGVQLRIASMRQAYAILASLGN